MNESKTQSASSATADFTRTWRYKLGLFLFTIGNLTIVLSALVFPFIGIGPGTIGALVLGGEGVSLLSIVFLGKEGFKAIKNKIFGAVKEGYTAPISRARHTLGIILFLLHVATAYVIVAYAWIAFGKTTEALPFPEIWGLNFEGQGTMLLWVWLIGEISFLISLYILGAEWWGRFRNIFVWKGEPE